MKTVKFLLAKTIFDLYLFKKPMRYYTEVDWFLNRWCINTFNEYKRYIEKGV